MERNLYCSRKQREGIKMKKWVGISVVILLLILTGMSCVVGKKTAENASAGVIYTGEGYYSQVIQSEDKDFVIYQNAPEGKFQIANTDKEEKEYQTVGTVHHGEVYYLFCYMQEQKQVWGMEPVERKSVVQWAAPSLEAEGVFLAAGSTETEILFSILGSDQKTITEYGISFDTDEIGWTKRSSFCLVEEHRILRAAYDGDKFVFQQDDGKVFCRDVLVKELESIEGTVLSSSFDTGVLDGAEGVWEIHAIIGSIEKCLLPAFITAMLVVLFLYGSSRKEAIVYRMLCYTEVVSVLCFIVVGYLCAGDAPEAILQIKKVVYTLIAIVTFVHFIAILVVASRWKKFTEAITYIATQKNAYSEIPKGNDGLQMVWAPLDIIGKCMSRQLYEKEVLYKNYYRFVPKGMESLLKKNELADIAIGDHCTVNGCMVNFSIENIKDYDVSQYMSVMTQSLKIMHKVQENYGGISHSTGADLLERKVFFEKNPEAALSFAVDLIHAYAQCSSLKNIDFIFMLHLSDYYYGISGVESMMTPFMFCKEEKVMQPYVEAFVKAKVKIALTEQTLALVGDRFSVRYIGFISNQELGNLRMYECLDAYNETKRRQMEATNMSFQNALELFYSNDFYLARNAFNEVLKVNEQDQIARWYLFHCEYQLNHPEAEITYGLFASTE